MPRSVAEWIGATDDSAIPPRVRLRVWDRCEGMCHRCRRKIPTGDVWIIEHLIALILGGENRERNLCLTCSWCKPVKDAEDVAAKSKTAAVKASFILPRAPSNWPRRGFPKREPRHEATRKIQRKRELS